MQINWTNIKAEILSAVKDIQETEPNFNANEAVDLFVKVINGHPNLAEFKSVFKNFVVQASLFSKLPLKYWL